MSLRYIVPSLGLLACAASASAVEVGGGLTITGYVDTVLAIEDGDLVGDDTNIQWSAEANIGFGYELADGVSALIELDIDDGGNIDLGEALITWAINEQAYIAMGKTAIGYGLEATDPTGLYRVNTSIVRDFLQPQDTVGVTVGFVANEMFSASLTLANTFYDLGGQASDEFAVIAKAVFNMDDIGVFEAALAYDMYDDDDVLGIDVSGLITALDDMNLTLGFNVNYTDNGDDSVIGIMAMGNMKFDGAPVPMAATLMASYLMWDLDVADDQDWLEIAAALLTQPTGDENFNLNLEVRYIDQDDLDDSIGFFLEMLAIIP